MLDPEISLCDPVLLQLAQWDALPVQGRRDVLLPAMSDQGGIHGIARPAEWRAAQRLSCVRARLAGSDGREHLLADGMLFGGVGVTDRLDRMIGAIAGRLITASNAAESASLNRGNIRVSAASVAVLIRSSSEVSGTSLPPSERSRPRLSASEAR